MPFPEPGGKAMPINNATGVPEGCGKNGGAWWQYYIADATGKSFQNLYDGKDDGGLRNAMALHWSTVAAAFDGHPGVLAYELLNEPWVGDHIGHPLRLAHPALADNASLAPFYDVIAAGIAAADSEHILAFSGAELGDRLIDPRDQLVQNPLDGSVSLKT